MELKTILLILLIHWAGDFWMQTSWMAMNKSKDWKALTAHILIYTNVTALLWAVFIISNLTAYEFIQIYGITFIPHWLTDFFTSQWTASLRNKLYIRWPGIGFFSVVGLDQILHYAQLFYIHA